MRRLLLRRALLISFSAPLLAALTAQPVALAMPGATLGPSIARTIQREIGAGPKVPGAQLWVNRYVGPGNSFDLATSMGVSPDGTKVFVTGESYGSSSVDYATVAIDSTNGSTLWSARYNGPVDSYDEAFSLGVSPDGSKVYVTGESPGSGSGFDYTTIAYGASNGAALWTARYNGPGAASDIAHSLSVSPDGSRVYVTGESYGASTGADYATIAYNASNGAQVWVKRYPGPGNGYDVATFVKVSPDGARVYVTGESKGVSTAEDATTIAYDATGTQQWIKRYNGPGNGNDRGISLGVSPDSSRVFMTGYSYGSSSALDYATWAWDASTGTKVWLVRYNGPANRYDTPTSLGVSPDGTKVFVTGYSSGSTSVDDYATRAYNASTGVTLWTARYNGPGNGGDDAHSLGVSLDGTKVFVTGESLGSTSVDYATIAYNASTGASNWVTRYNGPKSSNDHATSLSLSPDGTKVFITGGSTGTSSGLDYATVAYNT
jgi:DNA-binding beta-propeller fold protein YncE